MHSEELGREENKDLKSFVDKLAGVKKTIDDKGKTAGEHWCASIMISIGQSARQAQGGLQQVPAEEEDNSRTGLTGSWCAAYLPWKHYTLKPYSAAKH